MMKKYQDKILINCMSDQFVALVLKNTDDYDDSDDTCGSWEDHIPNEVSEEYMDATTITGIRRSIGKALEYLALNNGKEK